MITETKRKFVENDQDLMPVLRRATEDEICQLVEILRKNQHYDLKPDCHDPVLIANELQLLYGNTFWNLCRGHGGAYKHMVKDVATEYGARFSASPR